MVAERSTGDAATDVKAAAADASATGASAATPESNAMKAEEQEGEHESDADDNQFEDALDDAAFEADTVDKDAEDELKAPQSATGQSDAKSVLQHQSAPLASDVVISNKASNDTVSTTPSCKEVTKQEEPAPRQLQVSTQGDQPQLQQQRPATARSAIITSKPFVPLPPSKNWRTMALRSTGQLSRLMQAALLKTLLHAIRRGSVEGVKVAIERGVSLQYIDSRNRNMIMYAGVLERVASRTWEWNW